MAATLETAPTKPARKQAKEPKEPKGKTPREPKGTKAKAPKAAGKQEPKPKAPVWPSNVKPSLVFLPPKIRDAQAYRRSIRQAMLMSMGLLAITGVVYGATAAGGLGAKSDLDKELARTTSLKTEIAANQQVQEYYDGFILSKKGISDTLSADTSYSKVLNEVISANTVGASFTSISKKSDEACPTGDPFTASVAIGCIELTGQAPNMGAITAFVAGLQSKPTLLTSPYIEESGQIVGGASFKITVGYTKDAYSGKGGAFVPTSQEIAALNASAEAAKPAAGAPTPNPAEGGTQK